MKITFSSSIFLLFIFFVTVEGVKRNKAPSSSTSNNLNTASSSDVRLSAVNNPVLLGSSPSLQDSGGSPSGRVVQPSEPAIVNLTVEEIGAEYPWISNPQAISNELDLESGDLRVPEVEVENIVPGRPGPAGQKTPGGNRRTKFNNPKYLTGQLDGLNRDDYDFEVTQGVPAANGVYKVRLSQRWRRIKIYETSLVLEQESDSNMILESRDGEFLSAIEDDIRSEIPAVSKQTAFSLALSHNQDVGKAVENPSTELIVDTIGDRAVLAYIINYFVPASTASQPTTTTPQSVDIAYDCIRRCRKNSISRNCVRACEQRNPRQAATNQATPTVDSARRLPVSRSTNSGGKRPWVLMNANTGVIYKTWDGLAALLRPAPVYMLAGNPLYSEQEYREIVYRNTETDDCYYKKAIGGGMFLRVNDKTGSNKADGQRFQCAEAALPAYDATNGAASPRNSAFKWGSEVIRFMQLTSNSKWKFDVYIETHHDGTRAAWNGFSVQLGDGDWYFYPMATPDTVAHEIGHGFTEYNSNLQYSSQSGSMNEAYSDMLASAFIDSFFDYTGDSSYYIGHMGVKLLKPHRDLCNPSSDRLLFYDPKYPAIVSALDYTEQTGLHNGSALYSKAFCLLSKTPGWNIQLAFKVFTAANAVYWTPKETFNSGACGVRKAAYDLKNTEQALTDVDVAFAAVDIACNEANNT